MVHHRAGGWLGGSIAHNHNIPHTQAHVRLARAHCELGDFDAAAAKLACACTLQPEDAELQREYQVRPSSLFLFSLPRVDTTVPGMLAVENGGLNRVWLDRLGSRPP